MYRPFVNAIYLCLSLISLTAGVLFALFLTIWRDAPVLGPMPYKRTFLKPYPCITNDLTKQSNDIVPYVIEYSVKPEKLNSETLTHQWFFKNEVEGTLPPFPEHFILKDTDVLFPLAFKGENISYEVPNGLILRSRQEKTTWVMRFNPNRYVEIDEVVEPPTFATSVSKYPWGKGTYQMHLDSLHLNAFIVFSDRTVAVFGC
jgi:hypothetical protein